MSTNTRFNSIISSWSLNSRRNHSHVFTVTGPRCNWAEDWPFPCLTPGLARATRRAWRYALPSAARSGWAHQRVTPIQSFSWHVSRHSEEKISPDLPSLWPTPLTGQALTLPEELFKQECPCPMFHVLLLWCFKRAQIDKSVPRLFSKFGEKWRAGLLKLNDCHFFHSRHWEIFPA